jgi:alkylhydroperoxidase family enzyme
MTTSSEQPALPCRVPLRTSSDTEGKTAQILTNLEEANENLTIFRMLANAPNAFRPIVMLANALIVRSSLPAMDREVVVLHLAAKNRVSYEWDEHVPISAAVGITDAQRHALRHPTIRDDGLFTEAQLLAIRICDDLLDNHKISDECWAAGIDAYGSEAMIDLLIVVANWGAFVPVVIRGLGLEHGVTWEN